MPYLIIWRIFISGCRGAHKSGTTKLKDVLKHQYSVSWRKDRPPHNVKSSGLIYGSDHSAIHLFQSSRMAKASLSASISSSRFCFRSANVSSPFTHMDSKLSNVSRALSRRSWPSESACSCSKMLAVASSTSDSATLIRFCFTLIALLVSDSKSRNDECPDSSEDFVEEIWRSKSARMTSRIPIIPLDSLLATSTDLGPLIKSFT